MSKKDFVIDMAGIGLLMTVSYAILIVVSHAIAFMG